MTGVLGEGRPALTDALSAAAENGRVCALAAGGQRDLRDRAAAYPGLFPANPFDPTVFGAVALATAFGAPWCTREQLRIANRAALWVFAADWRIDYLSRSAEEADAVVAQCLAIADGTAPTDDELGRFLAEIRDEVAAGTTFAGWHRAWRTELSLMLTAMARERRWALDHTAGGDPPSFERYVANADNFGSSFTNVSHWLATADPQRPAPLSDLTVAGRTVQRVLRLVNDLATYERDVQWGDLNALMLVDRAVVTARIADLVAECLTRLEPLAERSPREAEYLSRQIGFSSGFYRVADFWGRL